ncbi:MAG: outer membrane lipoprotein-sorting protein [Candidatus Nitrospinota bacterium M3_3B_026]
MTLEKVYTAAFRAAALGAVILAAGAGPAMADDDPKARAIMEKVDARDDGDNMTSGMEMILIDKNGETRTRKLRSFIKDFGEDTYRLLFFLEPADVKNTGFLTYDYDDPDKDDDQWLYLPALRKTKRIATSDKSGSFMGSDFTYSDMSSRDIEDYDFKLLKEDEVKGHKVWLIQSTPRSKKVIDETGYEKSVVFIRQDNHVVVRAVHWTEDNKLKYFDVKELELIDGIWVAMEMTMTTKMGKTTIHKTILRNNDVKFNQSLDEDIFTIRRLEKGL